MVNARIQKTVANARVGYNAINARTSSLNTGRTSDYPLIQVGMPIGLLLALTYAQEHSLPSYGDFRPHARIST